MDGKLSGGVEVIVGLKVVAVVQTQSGEAISYLNDRLLHRSRMLWLRDRRT